MGLRTQETIEEQAVTAPLSNMSATITHEASMSRGAQYKCKRCKGSLVGGSANDCRRSPSGGYEHRDPPGCKHFNDLAKAKRAKPLQQSSGSRRDVRPIARMSSPMGRKPPSRTTKKDPLPLRPCARPDCIAVFQPKKQNHIYCSQKCGVVMSHRKNGKNNGKWADQQRLEKREREMRKFEGAAARGEHVHRGGKGTPGGTVCANGDHACKYWLRQNLVLVDDPDSHL